MQSIKPFDLNDCLQMIEQRRADVTSGTYDIVIEKDWVPSIDTSGLQLLGTYCPSSQELIAESTTSEELLKYFSTLPACIYGVASNPNAPAEALEGVLDTLGKYPDEVANSFGGIPS